MLTLRGRGVGRNELIRKVINLRNEIVKRGKTVAEFESWSYADVVDRALKDLGDLIGKRNDVIEPVYYVSFFYNLACEKISGFFL
jgi:hypothetical protein